MKGTEQMPHPKRPGTVKPNCRHFDWKGRLTEKYICIYIESEHGYHPHLHCKVCNITGNKPLPKEMSEKFEPLDVKPKELNTCRKCGKSYDPEFSTSNTYCDACDPSYYRCDLCGKPTDWISTLDYCCSDCTIEI